MNSHSVRFAPLGATNGDEARNIVTHGRWFVVNAAAPETPSNRLVDPVDLDYRTADLRPKYEEAILEPPGVPVLLAGLWSLTGDQRFIYIQILQLLIDSCMVLLVYWLSLKLFQRRSAALLAALLYAIYLPLTLVARIPHGDAWAGFFTIAALALILRARKAERLWLWLVGLGALIGLGAYFRPNLLLLPLAFALAAAPWPGWRWAVRFATVPLLVSGALLAPWTVHNYQKFDAFVPVRTSLGWTTWVGLGELPNDFGATGTDANAVATVRREHRNYPIGSPKFDRVLLEKSLSAIRDHPLFYGRLVGRRLLRATVLPTQTTTTSSTGFLKLLAWGQPALFVLGALTGILLFRALPEQRPNLALLAAIVIATVLPYALIHLEARFILAASFVYIILAAYGCTVAFNWFRRRRLQQIASTSRGPSGALLM